MLGLYSKSATLALLLLCLGAVHAAPLAAEKRTVSTALRLARDGDNLSQSTTVQTQETIQTAVGPMLQICTIKLDPITGDNGDPLVRETKSCTVQMTSSGNNASGSNGSNGSSDSGSSSSQSAAASGVCRAMTAPSARLIAPRSNFVRQQRFCHRDCNASEVPGSALPSGSTGSASGTTLTVAPSATASASSGGNGAVSAGSAVATETSASGSAAATGSASATASGSASATITDSASATGTGTAVGAAASDGSSATSAADTAATSAASFQLPGTKLQVLPIGLGVFAGISVIALIVVGLVTYERTKYRKAFRQRKLAESGAAMGYGGMA
ncbi:hypothetical protein C8Q79DRAFT_1056006 [Trametes meyenii]|nr:hypothetical protein C8Q79DRAFT_1056006 [Trametes meyenii]